MAAILNLLRARGEAVFPNREIAFLRVLRSRYGQQATRARPECRECLSGPGNAFIRYRICFAKADYCLLPIAYCRSLIAASPSAYVASSRASIATELASN